MNRADSQFQRLAIIAKPDDSERLLTPLRQLDDFLRKNELQINYDRRSAELLGRGQGMPYNELAAHSDLAIVIGGDGTLLHSAREMVDAGIPLLGINLGRLGFLVDISPDHMLEMLEAVLTGRYDEDQRMLLSARVGEQAPLLALNDVVVHKWNIARMIECEIRANGNFIDTQRSDGLIISTPTGSTAYALSGGGPLLAPGLDAIALVPICPHTLSNRPIVMRGDTQLEIGVCGKTNPEHVRITCDGQNCLRIHPGEFLQIRKHPAPLRLLHPPGHDHYEILRAKLGWGDSRTHKN